MVIYESHLRQWHDREEVTSGRSFSATYLQEALGVLQKVKAAVAAVVLLGDPAAGALHSVGGEEAGRPPPHLPLHLQVAAGTTAILREGE